MVKDIDASSNYEHVHEFGKNFFLFLKKIIFILLIFYFMKISFSSVEGRRGTEVEFIVKECLGGEVFYFEFR